MKVMFVNPLFPPSLWDFSHIRYINGASFPFPPLGLAVLAALTPLGNEVIIVDENIQDLDFTLSCDIVAITGYDIQKERALEIAHKFQQKRVVVALGGPMVNGTTLDEFKRFADTLFIGEAEQTWPKFLEDILNNSRQAVYRQNEFTPLSLAPIPRFDLLKLSSYATAIMETSRGCPFSCEFCEVPVRMGNAPRLKDPIQVLKEIELLVSLGADSIFIIDDNFSGNRKHAIAILTAIEHYQNEKGGPHISFSCQITLANAFDNQLLSLLRRCGFRWVFIGLETDDKKILENIGKRQNLVYDVIEAVRNIQSHNLVIWGGIIVGFDEDDEESIEKLEHFISEAGISVVMVSLLQALPGTSLYERIKKEGRLEDDSLGGVRGGKSAMLHSNIRHLSLSQKALAIQYLRLMENLYYFPNFARRLIISIQRAQSRQISGIKKINLSILSSLFGVIKYYCLTFDVRRIYYFFHVLFSSIRHRGLTFDTVFMHLAVYIHIRKFHEGLSLHDHL